jgi:hypothetical protein
MHLSMFLTVERARASSGAALVAYSALACLGLGAAFASRPAFEAIFIVVLIGEGLAPFAGLLVPGARVPLHVEHTAERVGLVMMIFLGESVGVVLLQAVAQRPEQYVGAHGRLGGLRGPPPASGSTGLPPGRALLHGEGCLGDGGPAGPQLQVKGRPDRRKLLPQVGLGLGAIVVWGLHLLYYHTSPEAGGLLLAAAWLPRGVAAELPGCRAALAARLLAAGRLPAWLLPADVRVALMLLGSLRWPGCCQRCCWRTDWSGCICPGLRWGSGPASPGLLPGRWSAARCARMRRCRLSPRPPLTP